MYQRFILYMQNHTEDENYRFVTYQQFPGVLYYDEKWKTSARVFYILQTQESEQILTKTLSLYHFYVDHLITITETWF